MIDTPVQRPVVLCVLDGWGYREETADNAVALAGTPVWDRLWANCPHSFLSASGRDVGLPEGQMGNSEVGHMNIGAGRVVMQDLPRIDEAIDSGALAGNEALRDFVTALIASGGTCHLMGLVSPGGVHAHQRHIVALAALVAQAGVPVRVHAFLDGRDTPPKSAAEYLLEFIRELQEIDGADLVTLVGRYYAMDRDKRWDRVERAHDLLVDGLGKAAENPVAAIEASYANGVTDEFVEPVALNEYAGMSDGDGVLCANFRADRVREILGALLDPEFDGFVPKRRVSFAAAAAMTEYSERLVQLMGVLFPTAPLANVLGEVTAAAGKRQLRLAETEKYPHVTFFLNGGEEAEFVAENRQMVASPKVATYDLKPEMSAPEVGDLLVAAIEGGDYDLIVVNFANPDMVGHTGDLQAAIRAVETVDGCVGRAVDALERVGGVMLLTADHGNCELMRDPETGGPHTAHTTNPVPLLLVNAADRRTALADGRLADLAPTALRLMGVPQPAEMTGRVLLIDAGRDVEGDEARAAE